VRPFTRSLLVIVLTFSFDAVTLSLSPVPQAFAQCAPSTMAPGEPCCDSMMDDTPPPGCVGLGRPLEGTGNEPWLAVGIVAVLGSVVFVAWRARRMRAERDPS
jgi:hypothetical protein